MDLWTHFETSNRQLIQISIIEKLRRLCDNYYKMMKYLMLGGHFIGNIFFIGNIMIGGHSNKRFA